MLFGLYGPLPMNTEDIPASDKVLAAEARRRRVFKRTVWFIVLCWVGLLGVRLWWGYVADRRLQAEIDRCHAAGEPILVEDFQRTTIIPNDENAAVAYQDAYAAMVRELKIETTISFDDILSDPRVCEAYPDDVRAYIEANAEALRLMRHARRLSKVDWGTRFTSPMMNAICPMLTPQRELSKLARTSATFHADDGNHAEAIETILDLDAMAVKLSPRGDAVLITHLVGVAIEAVAAGTLEEITPTLVTADAKLAVEMPANPVTVGKVTRLIRLLTNEDAIRVSAREAFYAERASLLDLSSFMCQGTWVIGGVGSTTVSARLLRPMFVLDGARSIRLMTRDADAMCESNWPAAQLVSVDDDELVPTTLVNLQARPVTCLFMSSFGRAIELHFRTLAMRRMAAVALAIRLYELDHGRRPASLEDLVPDYIEVLPVDPFAADERTFGYLPDIASPILYSVNSNGIDEGGEYVAGPDGRIDMDQKDLPYFLNSDRPRRPLKLVSDE